MRVCCRYVRYVEQYIATPSRLELAEPRPLRTIILRNLFPDAHDVPEAIMPWLVLSRFGALGRYCLDTKLASGAAGMAKCATQSGRDLVFELPGKLAQLLSPTEHRLRLHSVHASH